MTEGRQALEAAIEEHRAGRVAEAARLYRRVIDADPQNADAFHLLGIATQQMGDMVLGEALIRDAIALNPTAPLFHNNLGKALAAQRRWNDAVASHRYAVQLAPGYVDGWIGLGLALQGSEDYPAAEAAYRRVLELAPDHVAALNNLGIVLDSLQRHVDAVEVLSRAVALAPTMAEGYGNLGRVQGKLGLIADAVSSFRNAVERAPHDLALHDQLIFHLLALPTASNQDVARATRAYGNAYRGPAPAATFANSRDPARRLRIAYLSGGLRAGHNLLYIMEPIFRAHDRAQLELYCYGDAPYADEGQASVRNLVDVCRDTSGLDDAAVAEMIRRDGIDIVVSLLGRGSRGPRHSVLFQRPAPVQIAYNWVSSSGIPAVEYWIADTAAVPATSEETFTEDILRVPHLQVFQPPSGAPPVGPLPALRNGFITFGSFSIPMKVNDEVMSAWAAILDRMPSARLQLKAVAFGDPRTHDLTLERLRRAGVPLDRVDVRPPTASLTDHLAAYHEIDIALDTFPYTFGNTAFEALWMGVPVVSMAGPRFASRITLMILTAAGFQDLAVATPAEYVDQAAALAGDLDALAAWRQSARGRLESSPVMDYTAHTRALESAYREAWRRWCGQRA